MPWALAKNEADRDRLSTVLYNLLESIRMLAVELSPYMPTTADAIFGQIGTDIRDYDSLKTFGALPLGSKVGQAQPLFARIDGEKLLEELQKKQEAQQKKEKTVIEGLAQIGIEDFAKVELRAAKVVACEPIKRAKKLLKLTLDDGSDTPRIVASGIAQYCKPEDLIGHTVIVVANLKPAVLCGVESRGMILAADTDDGVQVLFADGMIPGAKLR